MIISELEMQVGPLEKESKKAKEYKEAKEKLESIDIALCAKDITYYSSVFEESKKEKEKLLKESEEFNTGNTKLNAELEKIKLEEIKLDNKINELSNDFINQNNLMSSLNNKKELIKERSKYEDDDKVKVNLIASKEKELNLKTLINKNKLDIDLLKEKIEKISSKLKILNEDFNENNKDKIILNDKLNKSKNILFNITNKIELLDRNIKEMDKVPYSVKNVLNNPVLPGILNILGNVIETKEEYNTMLSVALMSSFNFVITEDEDNAKEAIEYLKNKNLGRVTFFPLNIIKPKTIDPETMKIVSSMEGYISLASDLVTYDKKYYNIVMNQLGNIIVASTIDSMIKISKRINHRYRVISLTGEVMNTGGSMTGGSLKINNAISDKYELIKVQNEKKTIENEIIELEKKIKELEDNENIIKNNIYAETSNEVKLNTELKSLSDSNQTLIDEQTLLKDEIHTLSNGNEIDKELKKIMEDISKEESKKDELEITLSNYKSKKRDLLEEEIEKEKLIKKYTNNYSEVISKSNELEIEITKTSMKLDSLLNYLNEEYSMTYEKAKNNYSLDEDEEEARSITLELKKKLKSIGEVNTSSIEEYERVNKRYSFLIEQKEDLKKSEEDLLSIINEMDDVMKDKFINTFNSINKEFSKVFTKLFNGGEAYLELTNPNNLLETGIDIVAVPSGKKVKSLAQLSGGERTLTAVSLLFAIMNQNKVPFAVLDEIESALDEANVQKFGEYLNNYKGKTQLLIITHKKKTMEYVDILYGITMQESCVIKLVSVKLEYLN